MSILKFRGRKIVIATKHSKEYVIGPMLEDKLQVHTFVPTNFDTDRFGTFTRDVKRTSDIKDTARAKAEAAIDLCGVDLAVASEGAFGTDQVYGMFAETLELVMLVDRENEYEICGEYRGGFPVIRGEKIHNIEEGLRFAHEIGFPEFGLIVKDSRDGKEIYKDVQTEDELENLVMKMLSRPFARSVFLETDMRAHRNPDRMANIRKATEDLVKNILSMCPRCNAPGFVVTTLTPGLPCSRCNTPTDLPLTETRRCAKCGYLEVRPSSTYGLQSDPKYCEVCNP